MQEEVKERQGKVGIAAALTCAPRCHWDAAHDSSLAHERDPLLLWVVVVALWSCWGCSLPPAHQRNNQNSPLQNPFAEIRPIDPRTKAAMWVPLLSLLLLVSLL